MATKTGEAPVVGQKIILAAGTYDGVLAGYELDLKQSKPSSPAAVSLNSASDSSRKLKIVFASPVHGGSVRSLAVVSSSSNTSFDSGSSSNRSNSSSSCCLLLSSGYDEMLKTHDFRKRVTSSGEIRTPAEFGTPVCSSFAGRTHCLVGFGDGNAEQTHDTAGDKGGGKLLIYKVRDWSIQHVLAGHLGGVATVAVHPSNKLALTGGLCDGKLKVWDLERGRLAYSNPIPSAHSNVQGRNKHFDAIVHVTWSADGDCYAFCHGSHVSVRDVATGKDLLDVDLPSRANQVCLLKGPEGHFVAAACNDGSLPVLAVGNVDDTQVERRALMAIEPVDGPVAGEERFRCIQTVSGYHVATANSAGVVSLMNLQGAITMIINTKRSSDQDDMEDPESDDESDSENDQEQELAVEIIDSVRLGTGARITCLAVWASPLDEEVETPGENVAEATEAFTEISKVDDDAVGDSTRRKGCKFRSSSTTSRNEVAMNAATLEKARALVAKAKKIQKLKSKKKHKIVKS